MTATIAISKVLKNDPNPPKMAEIKEFKDSCTHEEWQEFGEQACGILGETFTG